MIALGVFFPVYPTFSGAIAPVDRGLVEVGAYGFGTPTLIRRILFPASLPTYVIGLRKGLGLGWMFVVAAEFLGARPSGLLSVPPAGSRAAGVSKRFATGLLGEPFSALEAFTRIDLQTHLIEVWDWYRPTTLLVTHDIDEALILADRVIVLVASPGAIQADITVDPDRPRSRTDPAFHRLQDLSMEQLGRSRKGAGE
jgi:hypothetical protein